MIRSFSPALRGGVQQLRDEVEIVECDIRTGCVTYPVERFLAPAYEPAVDMERDVVCDRGVDGTDLSQRSRPCRLVKGEADDVEQPCCRVPSPTR